MNTDTNTNIEQIKLCKDCVNFIVEDDKVSCDYEYFENDDVYKALIYVPEQFDCEQFEIIEEDGDN